MIPSTSDKSAGITNLLLNKPKGLKVAKEDQMADLADLRDQREDI